MRDDYERKDVCISCVEGPNKPTKIEVMTTNHSERFPTCSDSWIGET